MRVAIFGEDSFIARSIEARLLADPKKYQLVNSSRGLSSNLSFLPKKRMTELAWGPEVDATNEGFVEWIVSNSEVVINCAGLVGTDKCLNKQLEAYNGNVETARVISKACKSFNAKLIHFGTTASYDGNPITEESSPRVYQTMYGATKLLGEELVRHILPDALIFRPCFAYGGARDNSSTLKKLIYRHLGLGYRDFNVIPLDLTKKKDYLYVDDLVDAVVRCLEAELWGNTYNISYGSAVPYSVILDKLSREGISFGDIIWKPEGDYMGDHVVSNSKLMRVIPWTPKVTLDSGIRRIILEAQGSNI